MAYYDQPVSFDDVAALLEARYGPPSYDSLLPPREGWPVEPEKFAIQLSKSDEGMVRIAYLIFGAAHPTLRDLRAGDT
jgi:hypothetical protein